MISFIIDIIGFYVLGAVLLKPYGSFIVNNR